MTDKRYNCPAENTDYSQLLQRRELGVDRELVSSLCKNKTVMITGGAGSIGSELVRQALLAGCARAVVFDNGEHAMFDLGRELEQSFDRDRYELVIGSVRDKARLLYATEKFKPDIVFHAAAYKHVPLMEHAATEAVKTNIFGTKNVLEAAEYSGTEKIILISTDKAVNPSCVMGATKRAAEMLIQTHIGSTTAAAVRFGNVLGSSGSVIPVFTEQIRRGQPLTLTDKRMTRYFMSIPEAVGLIMQAGAGAKQGEIFVLEMGEQVSIYELAKKLLAMYGLSEKDLPIKITGLRPGEKLSEQLRYDSESVEKTASAGILITKPQIIDRESFLQKLTLLENAVALEDSEQTEKLLFDLISISRR